MAKTTRVRSGAAAKIKTQHGDQNSVPQGAIDLTKLASDVLSLLLPTGIASFYEGLTAPAGWILATGTIGNAASGASTRAAEDTRNLYRLYWNDYLDAQAPVSGGRGASADADFDAGKTLTIPDMRGRMPFTLDNLGGSVANRVTTATIPAGGSTLGATGGAETHLLTASESGVPAHNHGITDPGHTHPVPVSNLTVGTGAAGIAGYVATESSSSATTGITINNSTPANASQAHNNMPPTIGKSFIVKL